MNNNETEMMIDAKKNPFLSIAQGILIVISFYIMQFASSIVLIQMMRMQVTDSVTTEQLQDLYLMDMFRAMLIGDLVFIAVLVYIYRTRIKIWMKNIANNFSKIIIKLAMYYILLLAVSILASFIDQVFFSEYLENVGNNQEVIEASLQTVPSLAAIVTICFTGPIVEEYVFRYGVMSKVLGWMNPYLAAVVGALIFSFVHIGFDQAAEGIGYFIHLMLGYLPAALCFGLIYARENNLSYSIGLHIINNVQAVIVIIIAGMAMS